MVKQRINLVSPSKGNQGTTRGKEKILLTSVGIEHGGFKKHFNLHFRVNSLFHHLRS